MINFRPIDFTGIKTLVPLVDVLRSVGWEPTWQARGIMRGGCPIHRSRSPRPRSLIVTSDQWYCHRCHIGGDVTRLWRLLHDHPSDLAAALDLCRHFQVAVPRR